MQGYGGLYGGKPPHQSNSETSEAAADEIASSSRTIRFKVYAYIKRRGVRGATDEEVQIALKIQLQTEVPRRRELVLKGLIVDGGMKRRTVSRRLATVWVTPDTYVEPEVRAKTTKDRLKEARAEIGRLKARVAELERLICVTGTY